MRELKLTALIRVGIERKVNSVVLLKNQKDRVSKRRRGREEISSVSDSHRVKSKPYNIYNINGPPWTISQRYLTRVLLFIMLYYFFLIIKMNLKNNF